MSTPATLPVSPPARDPHWPHRRSPQQRSDSLLECGACPGWFRRAVGCLGGECRVHAASGQIDREGWAAATAHALRNSSVAALAAPSVAIRSARHSATSQSSEAHIPRPKVSGRATHP